jgi:hypothetical protein
MISPGPGDILGAMAHGFPALLVILWTASAAFAGGPGTTGAQFLNVGAGARELGMGGACSALTDGAGSIYWNPAGLARLSGVDASAGYSSLFEDQSQGFLAFAFPVKKGRSALGLSVDYLGVRGIEERAGDVEEASARLTQQNMAVSAAFAGRAGSGLDLALAVKAVREALGSFQASAFAADIGAQASLPIEGLRAGLAVRNLGTKIGPDPLPAGLRGGLGYRAPGSRASLAADLDWRMREERLAANLGAEVKAGERFSLRAGYQCGRSRDKLGSPLAGFSFGAGAGLDAMRIDYALLPFGDLGATHRVTLGWSFGAGGEERRSHD